MFERLKRKLSGRTDKAPDTAGGSPQAPAAMAAQAGNSAMAELISPPRRSARPLDLDLEQAIGARAASVIQGAGQPAPAASPAPDVESPAPAPSPAPDVESAAPAAAAPVADVESAAPQPPTWKRRPRQLRQPPTWKARPRRQQPQRMFPRLPTREARPRRRQPPGRPVPGARLGGWTWTWTGASPPRRVRRNLPASWTCTVSCTIRSGGGLGKTNSPQFNAVESAVEQVIALVKQPLGQDAGGDQQALRQLVSAYAGLLRACDAYTSRSAISSKGKARQEIVRRIRDQARQDFDHLKGVSDRLPSLTPEQRPQNMVQALGMARTRQITLKQGTESDLEHKGGAASYVAVLPQGAATDENASGFFQAEEVFDPNLSPLQRKRAQMETLAGRRPGYAQPAQEAIRGIDAELAGVTAPEDDQVSSQVRSRESMQLTLEGMAMDQADMVKGDHISSMLNAPPGATVNLTGRNVATSRMASLLGIGNLVAQSERAELHDAAGGGSQVGNLMQGARGQDVSSFFLEKLRPEAVANADPASIQHSPQTSTSVKFKDYVTPEFLRSLTSLQVLDGIVGQCDRHNQNYFAQVTPEGKLGQVNAIDNDFAFGVHSIMGGEHDKEGHLGNFGQTLVDWQGEIRLAHMDKGLAERILALRPDEVRLMLADVLEPWALDSLCERLEQTQFVIRKDMEQNPDSGRYLDDVSQWDDQALADLVQGGGRGAKNYVADLAAFVEDPHYSVLRLGRQEAVSKVVAQLKQEELTRIWTGAKDAPDKGRYLQEHGLRNDDVVEYVQANQDKFQFTPQETKQPDVKWVLDSIQLDEALIEQKFRAQAEKLRGGAHPA